MVLLVAVVAWSRPREIGRLTSSQRGDGLRLGGSSHGDTHEGGNEEESKLHRESLVWGLVGEECR